MDEYPHDMTSYGLIPPKADRPGDTMRRWFDELARCSDDEDRITRLFISKAHADSIDLIGRWMELAGMTTSIDRDRKSLRLLYRHHSRSTHPNPRIAHRYRKERGTIRWDIGCPRCNSCHSGTLPETRALPIQHRSDRLWRRRRCSLPVNTGRLSRDCRHIRSRDLE